MPLTQEAQLESLPKAYAVIKDMEHCGSWGEDLNAAMRDAVARVLRTLMDRDVDRYLSELASRDVEDRRNGSYERHVLTGLGDVAVTVPRTRTYSAKGVLGAYARRTPDVDRSILSCFVYGCSTRKVGKTLLPMLGERVSPGSVSRVAKTLDGAVAAFHARPLRDRYHALLLDGVVLARKTGAGALRRPVLVAVGLLPDGRKEVIDYRLAVSESQVEWERFLSDLGRRGFTGVGLKIVVSDGGAGLTAALPVVLPGVPHQRCWAHKTRNITDKVRQADRDKVKRGVQAIYLAANQVKARQAAQRFAQKWGRRYPRAVECLRRDLDELLTFLAVFKDTDWQRWVRTTNAIERRFVEVRRRCRPMGVFSDRTSMDRILYAVFTHENQQQGIATLVVV
jgi:putative transposase